MTRKSMPQAATLAATDQLRGASKGIIDAVTGITNIVEQMHRTILGLTPIVGKAPTDRTGGIPGFVYSSVRGVTHVVGAGLDVAFSQLTPFLKSQKEFPQREAMTAALNGVFGDYLAATNNPLAIPMQLRQQGRALSSKNVSPPKGGLHRNDKLVVLVHGLCMNDLQWNHERSDHSASHDHGAALARDLGYTAIYLHYNSGRHIATNGEEFAYVLENLIQDWPVPITELVIIGHSMGGLVARSACAHAKVAKHAWLKRLKKLIFLGTPHHGAPLERAGNWLDILLDISPYSAPFSQLGKVRSAGIKDLRHGSILDAETLANAPSQTLPKGVECFAIAATKQTKIGAGKRLPGDGLVPVNSALGVHKDAALSLPIPQSRQHICYGLDHFDLLSSGDVYDQLYKWLGQ
jgi:pimeloyl-ACP methyl ester carboxylesterase